MSQPDQGDLFRTTGAMAPAALSVLAETAHSSAYRGSPGHVAGSDTSEAAARSMKRVAGHQRAAVLSYFRGRGSHGATDDEVEAELSLPHQSASPRRRELELEDPPFVVKTAERRQTRRGRTAAVYVAAEYVTLRREQAGSEGSDG